MENSNEGCDTEKMGYHGLQNDALRLVWVGSYMCTVTSAHQGPSFREGLGGGSFVHVVRTD